MEKSEVQAIVYMTIQEFKRQGLLRDRYSVILREVEPVIKDYFFKKNNSIIQKFLRDYSDHEYIDIIYLHYRDELTLVEIAGIMGKDDSTIKRNKKKLIMEIYNRLEDEK